MTGATYTMDGSDMNWHSLVSHKRDLIAVIMFRFLLLFTKEGVFPTLCTLQHDDLQLNVKGFHLIMNFCELSCLGTSMSFDELVPLAGDHPNPR